MGSASGNVIELNTVTGNTNGIFLAPGSRQTLVRENTVVGNPAIQVGASNPDVLGVDILNLAPAGQTTFSANVCVSTRNASCLTGRRQQD